MGSVVHSSLHENCHHQLVYAKFNLKVWYPPPYEREIWHYQYANIDQIKRAVEQYPWRKSFRNLRINEMVYLFNKTIKNILSNYFPHESITCDDRDPPWIKNKIKQLIQEINNATKASDKVWHDGLIYKLIQSGVTGNLLNTFANFLKDRKQRVYLNGQNSTWVNVEAEVPQGSILGPLLFLIYTNDLPETLVLNPELFADDTSLFSVIFDKDLSAKNLNNDLNRINNWAFQWKMSFDPDPNKQVQEVLFSRKIQKSSRPSLIFNNNIVTQSLSQKHLGMFLDTKLDF